MNATVELSGAEAAREALQAAAPEDAEAYFDEAEPA